VFVFDTGVLYYAYFWKVKAELFEFLWLRFPIHGVSLRRLSSSQSL